MKNISLSLSVCVCVYARERCACAKDSVSTRRNEPKVVEHLMATKNTERNKTMMSA